MSVIIPVWLIEMITVGIILIIALIVLVLILSLLFNLIELYFRRIMKQVGHWDVVKFGEEYRQWKAEKKGGLAND